MQSCLNKWLRHLFEKSTPVRKDSHRRFELFGKCFDFVVIFFQGRSNLFHTMISLHVGKDEPSLMNLPVLGKNTPPASDGSTRNKKNGSFRKKLLRKRVIFPAVACILVAAAAVRFLGGGQTAAAAGQSYVTAAVERRDITAQITGSGTLEAANSYSVTTFVEGTILTADFEEGDQVEAGTVLYTIDDSDMSSTLEQAEISLNQSQRNYDNKLEELENLTLTAPKAGRVLSLDVEVGDEVSAGQTVATVRNSDTMCLELPFLADEAASFFVGQSASVTLDNTFETLTGTVTKISGNNEVLTGNVIVRNVTIEVSNPGGLSTTQTGSASIGGVDSAGSGSFTYEAEKAVTAQVSGEVSQIYVSEGSWVDQDAPILTLTSDALEDEIQSASESLRNAQLSLDSRYDQLDDYTVTSPIQGTIIDKNYNAGENAEANQVLCTIYDLSYLTMTLSVDELDISSIAVGQQVSVTADAVEGTVYQGVVTKVSVAGTSSGSATTYPVTIRIDETDGLLPGMNVDASITLNSAEDVLAIPSAALNRGDTVLVTADSPSAANGTLSEVTGTEGEEYYSVTVEVGTSDSSYLEITSGLQEGDTVVYIPTTASSETPFGMMGTMPAGGMGGAMPSGGMGGGPGGR